MNGNPQSRRVDEPLTATLVPSAAPPEAARARLRIRKLLGWVYTNNPFYALSAVLFFWGLWSSCYTKDYWAFKTVTLMVGLGAYLLLLAAATFLVVRWGKVWEDGRSLLLLMVVMFLGLSVSFDDALTGHFSVGAVCSLAGLAYSMALSETVLRGLKLRLGACLRIPYYLALALFYLYPVLLGSMDQQGDAVPWVVFAFPTAAGLVFLTLLPAVRRGPQYVRDNGSPWPWPWFPWTLFALLALAVGPRSYYLAVSMHQVGGLSTIFAPYFLVPLAVAVSLLVLEIALVARSTRAVRVALAIPAAWLVLASFPCGAGEIPMGFLADFREAFQASPLFLTLVLMAVFYFVAAARRVRWAVDAAAPTLVAMAFVGRDTFGADSLVEAQALPLLLAAAVQAGAMLPKPNSVRTLLAASLLVASAAAAFRGTWFTAWDGFLPRHVLLGVVLLLPLLFEDRFARVLEYLAAVVLLVCGVTAAFGSSLAIGRVPATVYDVYPGFAIAAALVFGWLLKNRLYYALAAVTALCWGLGRGGGLYGRVRRTLPGLPYLIIALAVFAVALVISLLKARGARRVQNVQDHRTAGDGSAGPAFGAH